MRYTAETPEVRPNPGALLGGLRTPCKFQNLKNCGKTLSPTAVSTVILPRPLVFVNGHDLANLARPATPATACLPKMPPLPPPRFTKNWDALPTAAGYRRSTGPPRPESPKQTPLRFAKNWDALPTAAGYRISRKLGNKVYQYFEKTRSRPRHFPRIGFALALKVSAFIFVWPRTGIPLAFVILQIL